MKRLAMLLKKQTQDRISSVVFASLAVIVILITASIFLFVGSNAYQTFTVGHVSLHDFFLSTNWDGEANYGILVYIVGSVSLILVSLVFAVPLAVATALFITEMAPPWLGNLLRNTVELLLGIPSVIFGLIGLLVVVPVVSNILNALFADGLYFFNGLGLIAAAIVITFMIVPTITTISVDALRAIPRELREGSLALGATRWQTISRTVVPAALPGIMTGVILGAARVLGETVAVALVIGGAVNFPFHLTNAFPYIYLGPTSVLTLILLNNSKEAVAPQTVYYSLWSVSLLLLVISALFVWLSRSITARRVY